MEWRSENALGRAILPSLFRKGGRAKDAQATIRTHEWDLLLARRGSDMTEVPENEAKDMSVLVEINIGGCNMPLSALRRLRVGDKVAAALKFPRAMATSAGESFAEVELVKADDLLGIRIRSVSGD